MQGRQSFSTTSNKEKYICPDFDNVRRKLSFSLDTKLVNCWRLGMDRIFQGEMYSFVGQTDKPKESYVFTLCILEKETNVQVFPHSLIK